MLNIAVGGNSPYEVAALATSGHEVFILDTRRPNQLLNKIMHSQRLNALSWSKIPGHGNRLCTVSEDHLAIIWKIEDFQGENETQFEASGPIYNIAWSREFP